MMLAASASFAQSSTASTETVTIPRSTFELAKKAADEVLAGRVLIDRQEREIQLLHENAALKDQVIEALKENSRLKDGQLKEKDTQIESKEAARKKAEEQLTIETKEKEKAQRKAKFWRKIGTLTGSALAAILLPKVL